MVNSCACGAGVLPGARYLAPQALLHIVEGFPFPHLPVAPALVVANLDGAAACAEDTGGCQGGGNDGGMAEIQQPASEASLVRLSNQVKHAHPLPEAQPKQWALQVAVRKH